MISIKLYFRGIIMHDWGLINDDDEGGVEDNNDDVPGGAHDNGQRFPDHLVLIEGLVHHPRT